MSRLRILTQSGRDRGHDFSGHGPSVSRLRAAPSRSGRRPALYHVSRKPGRFDDRDLERQDIFDESVGYYPTRKSMSGRCTETGYERCSSSAPRPRSHDRTWTRSWPTSATRAGVSRASWSVGLWRDRAAEHPRGAGPPRSRAAPAGTHHCRGRCASSSISRGCRGRRRVPRRARALQGCAGHQ
jgi:hypothetical protein